MPVYEYFCNQCNKKIELLIIAGEKPICPDCMQSDLQRLFSTFASPGIKGGKSSSHSCSSCGPGSNCSTCKC